MIAPNSTAMRLNRISRSKRRSSFKTSSDSLLPPPSALAI